MSCAVIMAQEGRTGVKYSFNAKENIPTMHWKENWMGSGHRTED